MCVYVLACVVLVESYTPKIYTVCLIFITFCRKIVSYLVGFLLSNVFTTALDFLLTRYTLNLARKSYASKQVTI